MKWVDFIERCKELGVNDDTEVCYENMNFGGNAGSLGKTDIQFNPSTNELSIDSMKFEELN